MKFSWEDSPGHMQLSTAVTKLRYFCNLFLDLCPDLKPIEANGSLSTDFAGFQSRP